MPIQLVADLLEQLPPERHAQFAARLPADVAWALEQGAPLTAELAQVVADTALECLAASE